MKSVASPFQASRSDPNSSFASSASLVCHSSPQLGHAPIRGRSIKHDSQTSPLRPAKSRSTAPEPGDISAQVWHGGESSHLLRRRKVRRRAEHRTVAGTIKVRAILMVPSSRSCAGRLAIKVNRILDPDETRILNAFVHVTTLVPAADTLPLSRHGIRIRENEAMARLDSGRGCHISFSEVVVDSRSGECRDGQDTRIAASSGSRPIVRLHKVK